MYSFFRPILFKLDPEVAHNLTLNLVRLAGIIPPTRWLLKGMYSVPEKPVEVFGLRFKNPVGLAAGYDKDAIAIRGLSTLGFSHIEVGTVTPCPQAGNPKPRVFRLVEDKAVINRMGFPGKGMAFVEKRIRKAVQHPSSTLIGINLGKNKDTPLEMAEGDYVSLLHRFMGLGDYLVINVSSPNTVGLRRLQGRAMLEKLLKAIASERVSSKQHVPILVKLAPDLDNAELEDALGEIVDSGMDGVIATNTTLMRENLRSRHQGETGGLSGLPLKARSEIMLERILKSLAGRLPVVSVGGIMTPEDAKRRLDVGAALVQVYSGLVYAGPGLVKKIIRVI